VIADGDLRVVSLDRDSFVRLLGPIDHILKRNQTNYEQVERNIYDEQMDVSSAARRDLRCSANQALSSRCVRPTCYRPVRRGPGNNSPCVVVARPCHQSRSPP
jgi:hypothetical protein